MTKRVVTALPERDRVSKAYLGLLDIGPFGDRLRRRIDWMVDEVRGPLVLDVGCSEGILEVLLARHGLSVTGVDLDPDALDFARQLLAKEPDEVRERVRFVQGDFIKTRQVKGLFDTVVMGELLGHLDDPGAMLDRGLEHLRSGGQVVITTPFGVQPHEGHHQTLRLTDLIELLKPRFGLERLSVEDDHLRFVGRLSEDSHISWQRLDAEAVLSMTDAALAASQREFYRMLAARGSRIERLQQRLQQRVEVDRATQHKVNKGNEKAKRIEFRAKLDRIALTQLKKLVAARTEEVKARTREVKAETREVEAKAREVRLMSNRLHATRSSTSFLVGSTIGECREAAPNAMEAAVPDMLRLYRSKSTPLPPGDRSPGSHKHSPIPYVPEEPEP